MNSPPPSEPQPTGEGVEHPTFHEGFFWVSLGIAFVLGVGTLVALHIFNGNAGLSGDDWHAMTSGAKFAAGLSVPITVLGVALVCLGSALAVTEWRGTLRDEPDNGTSGVVTKGAADDIAKVVDSVGKLRGPALLLISGALMLGSTAWIATNAAKPPAPPAQAPAGTNSGTTPTP